LSGNFPIGFLIWQTNQNSINRIQIGEISVDVLDKKAQPIGEKKFENIASKDLLSNWIIRPKANNVSVIPLKNAVTPATATKDSP
jgi:hypothetical protein